MLIPAADRAAWRALLTPFGQVDPCFLPEYHLAYSLRVAGSQPLLWHYAAGGEHLLYPFLLTPVVIGGKPTGHFDIGGVYGYTGPLATSPDPSFLAQAWRVFDAFALERNVIAEFIRFSPFHRNERLAHPQVAVETNRLLAVSQPPESEEALLALLGAKTRNMLRKAAAAGLTARELALAEHLPAFRRLYEETMRRNAAPEFFRYDDAYWEHLLPLGAEGLRLFGVFSEGALVAAAVAVAHGQCALYHLGASLPEYAKLGAGNLSLFHMSLYLARSGVSFINMTGGRSTDPGDPLLLFKKSNATGTATFYIGRRVVDPAAYQGAVEAWERRTGQPPDAAKVIFWR